jgi:hypothetical protein
VDGSIAQRPEQQPGLDGEAGTQTAFGISVCHILHKSITFAVLHAPLPTFWSPKESRDRVVGSTHFHFQSISEVVSKKQTNNKLVPVVTHSFFTVMCMTNHKQCFQCIINPTGRLPLTNDAYVSVYIPKRQ